LKGSIKYFTPWLSLYCQSCRMWNIINTRIFRIYWRLVSLYWNWIWHLKRIRFCELGYWFFLLIGYWYTLRHIYLYKRLNDILVLDTYLCGHLLQRLFSIAFDTRLGWLFHELLVVRGKIFFGLLTFLTQNFFVTSQIIVHLVF